MLYIGQYRCIKPNSDTWHTMLHEVIVTIQQNNNDTLLYLYACIVFCYVTENTSFALSILISSIQNK